MNKSYIDKPAKQKTRILRQTHTADPSRYGQQVVPVHYIPVECRYRYDFLPTPTGSAVCIWRHILVFHVVSSSTLIYGLNVSSYSMGPCHIIYSFIENIYIEREEGPRSFYHHLITICVQYAKNKSKSDATILLIKQSLHKGRVQHDFQPQYFFLSHQTPSPGHIRGVQEWFLFFKILGRYFLVQN